MYTPGDNIRYVGSEKVRFNAAVPETLRTVPYKAENKGTAHKPLYRKSGFNEKGFIVRDFNMNAKITAANAGWAAAVEHWGFQFHFNPNTIHESFTPLNGLDYMGFIRDIATNPMFLIATNTGTFVNFELLLDRREDQSILRRDDWRSYYPEEDAPTEDDRNLILKMGTQYDVEHFFRTVNLDPVETWREGYKTSDWGLLMACPVILTMGDSEGCRKFRGQVVSLGVTHMQYYPGMIPVYSKMTFSFSRFPDVYGDPAYSGESARPGSGPSTPSSPSVPDSYEPPTGDPNLVLSGLDRTQSTNARAVVQVAKALKVPERGWVVGLITAMQESSLRNLGYGDDAGPDSRGLFQQRKWWGTEAERTNVNYACRAFYGGPSGPNRGDPPGLLDIRGWENMSYTLAAQAVQRSAYPYAYAKHVPSAQRWLKEMGVV